MHKIKNMKPIFCIILLLISQSQLKEINILFLTDIHLDYLYDSNSAPSDYCRNKANPLDITQLDDDFGRPNCDSPKTLFNSMLSNLKTKYEKLDLIILTGDQIAHFLYSVDIGDKSKNKLIYKQIFEYIEESLRKLYPSATVLPVVGNNDFYEYYTTPDAESRKTQTDFFRKLYFNSPAFDKGKLNGDYKTTVNDGLYYSYQYDKDLKFIMFNSVIFNKKNKNYNTTDCDRELSWLENELKGPGRKIISMHVPFYPFYWNFKTEFYANDEVYVKKFDDLMFKYRDTILNVFSSHLHWNKFGVRVRDLNSMEYLYEMDKLSKEFKSKDFLELSKRELKKNIKYFNNFNFASLSPAYHCNPSYTVIDFNMERLKIGNIQTHSADLRKAVPAEGNTLEWSIQYNLQSDLGFTNFDNEDMYDFIYNRVNQPDMLKLYPYYTGGFPRYEEEYFNLLIQKGNIDPSTDFRKLFCPYKEIFEADLKKCEEL
jgi:predicted MPP superfamily phosphohydrolase